GTASDTSALALRFDRVVDRVLPVPLRAVERRRTGRSLVSSEGTSELLVGIKSEPVGFRKRKMQNLSLWRNERLEPA
ncbi:MAG: hypothetical protein ACK58T_15735, partial [Phycisphaerae bacterium]